MKNSNISKLRTLALSIVLLVFMLICGNSCDFCLSIWTRVPIVKTPSGELEIIEIRDQLDGGRNYLKIILKGEGYTIYPDSLKLVADNEKYYINYYVFKTNQPHKYSNEWPESYDLISNNYNIDNDSIYVRFKAHSIFVKDRNKKFEKSPIYNILPCGFIKCDGKSIITDTITINVCKCPIIFYDML